MFNPGSMSKDLSNLIGLYLLGAIIAAVASWMLFYSGQLNQITELQTEQAEVEQDIVDLESLKTATEELRDNFQEVQQDRNEILSLLPEGSEAEDLLLLLAQYASDSTVALNTFSPQTGNRDEGLDFTQYEVQLTLTGKYDNLLTFFEKIENGSRYIDVVSYNLSSSTTSSSNPDLDLSIELVAYYQQSNEVGSVDKPLAILLGVKN